MGYFREKSGLGEIARLLVATLGAAGIPHSVVPAGGRGLLERIRGPLASPVYDTNIVCVNPDLLPELVGMLGHSFFRDRRTIGFWWWEVEELPREMAWAAYLVDEIWVGTEHVRRVLAEAVPKPVSIFPLPIRPPDAAPLSRRDFKLPEERFLFFFSFNHMSVTERKNPLGLIDTFSRAFAPNEGPMLLLKTVNGAADPSAAGRLRDAAAGRPDVILLEASLPAERQHALTALCDCYVSLHRAEGFGLGLAEAMAYGKPAVATGYSGNLDFMTEENSYLVPYELVPVPTGMGPYPAGTRWAEPDLNAAAAILRRIVENPAEARQRGERAGVELRRTRSLDRSAEQLRATLEAPPVRVPKAEERLALTPFQRVAFDLMWGPDLERARPWARAAREVTRGLMRPYQQDHRRTLTELLTALENPEEKRPDSGRTARRRADG